MTIKPERSLKRNCLATSRAASRFIFRELSSWSFFPTNLPLFTSTTTIASVFSMIKYAPLFSQAFGRISFSISLSIPKLSNNGAFNLYNSNRSRRLGEISSKYFSVFLYNRFESIIIFSTSGVRRSLTTLDAVSKSSYTRTGAAPVSAFVFIFSQFSINWLKSFSM